MNGKIAWPRCCRTRVRHRLITSNLARDIKASILEMEDVSDADLLQNQMIRASPRIADMFHSRRTARFHDKNRHLPHTYLVACHASLMVNLPTRLVYLAPLVNSVSTRTIKYGSMADCLDSTYWMIPNDAMIARPGVFGGSPRHDIGHHYPPIHPARLSYLPSSLVTSMVFCLLKTSKTIFWSYILHLHIRRFQS